MSRCLHSQRMVGIFCLTVQFLKALSKTKNDRLKLHKEKIVFVCNVSCEVRLAMRVWLALLSLIEIEVAIRRWSKTPMHEKYEPSTQIETATTSKTKKSTNRRDGRHFSLHSISKWMYQRTRVPNALKKLNKIRKVFLFSYFCTLVLMVRKSNRTTTAVRIWDERNGCVWMLCRCRHFAVFTLHLPFFFFSLSSRPPLPSLYRSVWLFHRHYKFLQQPTATAAASTYHIVLRRVYKQKVKKGSNNQRSLDFMHTLFPFVHIYICYPLNFLFFFLPIFLS